VLEGVPETVAATSDARAHQLRCAGYNTHSPTMLRWLVSANCGHRLALRLRSVNAGSDRAKITTAPRRRPAPTFMRDASSVYVENPGRPSMSILGFVACLDVRIEKDI